MITPADTRPTYTCDNPDCTNTPEAKSARSYSTPDGWYLLQCADGDVKTLCQAGDIVAVGQAYVAAAAAAPAAS